MLAIFGDLFGRSSRRGWDLYRSVPLVIDQPYANANQRQQNHRSRNRCLIQGVKRYELAPAEVLVSSPVALQVLWYDSAFNEIVEPPVGDHHFLARPE